MYVFVCIHIYIYVCKYMHVYETFDIGHSPPLWKRLNLRILIYDTNRSHTRCDSVARVT